jgi:hypothetical protein
MVFGWKKSAATLRFLGQKRSVAAHCWVWREKACSCTSDIWLSEECAGGDQLIMVEVSLENSMGKRNWDRWLAVVYIDHRCLISQTPVKQILDLGVSLLTISCPGDMYGWLWFLKDRIESAHGHIQIWQNQDSDACASEWALRQQCTRAEFVDLGWKLDFCLYPFVAVVSLKFT